MTRDWVWIITDAQTDRVSSGFSLESLTLTEKKALTQTNIVTKVIIKILGLRQATWLTPLTYSPLSGTLGHRKVTPQG